MYAIHTKYHGQTNYRPARMSVRAGKHRRWYSAASCGDYTHSGAVSKFLLDMQWTDRGMLVGGGMPDASMVWVFVKSPDRVR